VSQILTSLTWLNWFGGLGLGLSPFSILFKQPQKMILSSKAVKSDLKKSSR